jgi:hypothetical protein
MSSELSQELGSWLPKYPIKRHTDFSIAASEQTMPSMRLQLVLPQFPPGLLARHLLRRLLQLLQLPEAILARHLGLEPEVPSLSMVSVVEVRIRGQLSVLLGLPALSRVSFIRNACENFEFAVEARGCI